MLGALLLAFEGMLIRILAKRDEPLVMLVHVNVFGLLMLTLPAWWTWQTTTLVGMAPYLLLGPLVVVAQYCIVRGYALAPLAVVGPVDYAWLVLAALIGMAFFDEVPTIGVVVGSLIIAAGGVILARADVTSRRASALLPRRFFESCPTVNALWLFEASSGWVRSGHHFL